MPSNRSPGQPRRHEIDRLATRMWFTAVSLAAKLPAGELEKHIRIDLPARFEAEWTQTSAWYGYRNGRRSPNQELLETVESQYPGTAAWKRSPLWVAMKSPSMKSNRTQGVLEALSLEAKKSLNLCFPAFNAPQSINGFALIQTSIDMSAETAGALFLLQKTPTSKWYRRQELLEAIRRWLFLQWQQPHVVRHHWGELVALCATYAPELGNLRHGLREFRANGNAEGFEEIFSRGFAPGVFLEEN